MSKKPKAVPTGYWTDNRQTYQRVKEVLTTCFPTVFNSNNPLPLSETIKSELIAKGDPLNITEDEYNIFFKFWTNRTEYLENCKRLRERYNLDGSRAGDMSRPHIAYAEKRLRHRKPVLFA